MALVYVGIDEAGYGPLLGPLTIASSTFRVEGWRPGDPAPDLWSLLAPGVCRKGRDAKGRIAVDDSKKLKGANDSKRHPLTHLERGVLSFLSARVEAGDLPTDDAQLLEMLGAKLEHHPWYEGRPAPLPVSAAVTDEESIDRALGALRIGANPLRGALETAGVTYLGCACKSVGETLFNQTVRKEGSKAACTAKGVGFHLRTVWDHYARDAGQHPEEHGVRVVCDRQGGRVDYEDHLGQMVPGSSVETIEQRPERSRYELTGRGEDGAARAMTVLFMPEAESAHLPVALASMTAKYVRELVMGRFNRFWKGRMPELKPTAGYREDAARWLRDAARIVTRDERTAMCRIA
ncbi:MAG: hypothetical protein ACT4PL_13360 [Phycisphaerales bacterium]